MFLQRATMGGWLLIASATLLCYQHPVMAQEDQSPPPAPEPIREEPLPIEVLTPPPASATVPAPPSLLETLTEARRALHIEPDAQEPRLVLGRTLFQLGDTDGAIDEYRTALRFHPTVAQAHVDLGTALMAKQDWRAAMAELQEAVRLDPALVQDR